MTKRDYSSQNISHGESRGFVLGLAAEIANLREKAIQAMLDGSKVFEPKPKTQHAKSKSKKSNVIFLDKWR